MEFRDKSPGQGGPIDWQEVKRSILEKLDVAAEYRALGVETTREGPNGKGLIECRAFGRQDERPSAFINVRTGVYHDSGGAGETTDLFNFALKHGHHGRWIDVVRHYAEKAGVDVGGMTPGKGGRIREAEYDYRDESGAVLFRVFRYRLPNGKKEFSQHPPDGRGGWKTGAGCMAGVRLVPYRLPELVAADPEEPAWILEGEKDCERAASLGLVASCNPMGAGKWQDELNEHFRDRVVFIVPDNDERGRAHALLVAAKLRGVARVVKVVALPGLPPKGDLSDWLDAGGTLDELGHLAHAAPIWEPTTEAEEKPQRRPAHLGDLRKTLSGVRWIWDGWLPAARISGVAALEGCGKTRFTLDLARRVFLGLPWPDGQAPTFPAGTPTLWICADGNQDDLTEAVQDLGLPDEAIYLNTLPEDVYGGTDLDSEDVLADLREFLPVVKPAFVVIDTLTNATRRDLCRQNEVKVVMTPLKEIAQELQVPIIVQLHLSREGQALGRRIRGLTRTLIHLDCPNPDAQPDRRKLWVEKSFAKKPAALGVTMTDRGNEYDTSPPLAVAPPKGPAGRPATERDRARQFILMALRLRNDRKATDLCAEFLAAGGAENTFWRARDELVTDRQVTCDGKPKVIHLVNGVPANGIPI